MRITIVSLITILCQLYKAKLAELQKVLDACQEVWDLLTFADECDIDLQANEISLYNDLKKNKDHVCMAAEKEFYKIQLEHNKRDLNSEERVIEARRTLEDLLQKCIKTLLAKESLLKGEEPEEDVAANLSDSKDWVEIAPKYHLYKLCKLMLLDEGIEDFVKWTHNAWKNVIACCVSRLPDMLVKQCWKWAQEFEEDKLWEAIAHAGKCRGMMEAWITKGMEPV